MSVFTYYAIGATLAGMVNLEYTYDLTAHVVPNRALPLTGVNRKRAMSGKMRHSGAINGSLYLDVARRADLNAFMNAIFGGWETASVQKYMTLISEDGFYMPVLAYLEKPVFEIVNDVFVRPVEFGIAGAVVQSVTKTANYTVTTSDHFVKGDTTSGNVTLALPALAGVTPYVPYVFLKVASSNNLVLDPSSTEQVDGASTKTLTALYSRAVLVYDGTQWVTIQSE